jgi:hypothetical protein
LRHYIHYIQASNTAGGDNATFLVYSADATLNLDTMEMTHNVTSSNRKDFLGRTLVRTVAYDNATSALLLTTAGGLLRTTSQPTWFGASVGPHEPRPRVCMNDYLEGELKLVKLHALIAIRDIVLSDPVAWSEPMGRQRARFAT